MKVLKGIGSVPGVAWGKALWIKPKRLFNEKIHIKSEQVNEEIKKFKNSVDRTVRELVLIEDELRRKVGEERATIIAAQRLIATDQEIVCEIEDKIKTELLNAKSAVYDVFSKHVELIKHISDDYLASRSIDLEDVGCRLLASLTDNEEQFEISTESAIILAQDLTPSQIAEFNLSVIKGIVLLGGGPTSHTIILARSMNIPVIIKTEPDLALVQNGSEVYIDGKKGLLYIEPGQDIKDKLWQKKSIIEKERAAIKKLSGAPAKTVDGVVVEVGANIGSLKDAVEAFGAGADGIGLFRTEFLFLDRDEAPSEDEQFEVYKEVASLFPKNQVLIRTMDIGGDKHIPYVKTPEECNPFLGVRGIRFAFKHSHLFYSQIRALCRASAYGNVGVMLPMICVPEEIAKASSVIKEVQSKLSAEDLAFNSDMDIGIMIETPAAALAADQLAQLCSFFSIGTNDLLQYTMAVDRLSENLSYLYQPDNIVMARLISFTVKAANNAGISVSICGEVAGDPKMLELLIGLGLRRVSVAGSLVPTIKQAIRDISAKDSILKANSLLQGIDFLI